MTYIGKRLEDALGHALRTSRHIMIGIMLEGDTTEKKRHNATHFHRIAEEIAGIGHKQNDTALEFLVETKTRMLE